MRWETACGASARSSSRRHRGRTPGRSTPNGRPFQGSTPISPRAPEPHFATSRAPALDRGATNSPSSSSPSTSYSTGSRSFTPRAGAQPRQVREPTGATSSVVDRLDALLLHLLEVVPHALEDLGVVSLPVRDLADHAQGFAGAVRAGRVAREAHVGQVGVVLFSAGGFDAIDPAGPLTQRQLRSPDRRIEGPGQVDEVRCLLFPEVGAVALCHRVSRSQIDLGAVVEGTRILDAELKLFRDIPEPCGQFQGAPRP